jgi:hypothetical protein
MQSQRLAHSGATSYRFLEEAKSSARCPGAIACFFEREFHILAQAFHCLPEIANFTREPPDDERQILQGGVRSLCLELRLQRLPELVWRGLHPDVSSGLPGGELTLVVLATAITGVQVGLYFQTDIILEFVVDVG